MKGKGGIGCVYYVLVVILGVAFGASVGYGGYAYLMGAFWAVAGADWANHTNELPFFPIGGIIGAIIGPIIGIAWLKAQANRPRK
jgi:hypothetical protein